MNRLSLILILSLLLFGMIGCREEGDDGQIDLSLLDGFWVVADQGNQDVFDRNCILDVTTSSGAAKDKAQGWITTFYLSVGGTPIHDKVYNWYVRGVENHRVLLELVYQGELDSDDLWDGNYFYKVIELTDTHMSWQVNTVGDNSVIKFRRHFDLNTIK